MMFWLILMIIVFNRIIFHTPLPEKLLPTLFILIAPPAVGFMAYVKLTGSLDAFAQILFNFALFLTILLLSQLPRFARLPFFMSWWAYSFPLAAVSIATLVMYQKTQNIVFSVLGMGLFIILTLFIIMLIIKTIKAVLHKKICLPE
ncbi:MAG: C4-dicarboxylate ABC transporter, partial [Thiotrichaceae bacterium]|nr:C4-dicarboxylate ABC transporter [Thiotrichaceae bacterium]